MELLRHETPEFLPSDMWLPNNRDIKSADYCIWGVMQEQVYHMTILDVAELWQRLMNTWAGFQQSAIDETTDQWQKRFDGSAVFVHKQVISNS